MSFNIPFIMVIIFLLAILGVTFLFTKSSTSFQEYAVGNKQFSTAYLVSTVVATAIGGGGVMLDIVYSYTYGLIWIFFTLLISNFFSFWMISRLALRMGPFMYNLSMSDSIGRAYGPYPRVIAALSYIALSVVVIAMQIHTLTITLNLYLGPMNPTTIMIFTMAILIGYTSIGGIRSVTVTDIIQLLVFFIGLPMLVWYFFTKANKSLAEILAFLQTQEKFQLSSLYAPSHKFTCKGILSLLLSDMLCIINPTFIQRVYMSKDRFQASRVFLYSAIVASLIAFWSMFIGLLTFVAMPKLPETEIWNYIIANVPLFWKGILTISLLAIAMSTADSYLNTCSVIFSHDVVENIMLLKAINIPYRYQLRLAQLTAFLIGIAAIHLSYCCSNLSELFNLALYCSIPIATGPFILAVWGLRSTSPTALIGMMAGLLSTLAWRQWIEPKTGVHGACPCMLVNCLVMLIIHYIGIQRTKRKFKATIESIRKSTPKNFISINSIRNKYR